MLKALHIKNLQDYMTHASQISGLGKEYEFSGNLVVYNGLPDSVFNWVFCKGDISKECALQILSFIQKMQWEVTWVFDSDPINLKDFLKENNINQVSAPKKAYINLLNIPHNQCDLSCKVELIAVDSKEKLEIFDQFTSKIFFHKEDMVNKFLIGILDCKQSTLQPFLVKLKSDLVGTCTLYIKDKIAGFYADGVFPKYRNQGIGSAALFLRAQMAKKLGAEHAIAHCMSASVGVYKRFGFRMLGRLPLYA